MDGVELHQNYTSLYYLAFSAEIPHFYILQKQNMVHIYTLCDF